MARRDRHANWGIGDGNRINGRGRIDCRIDCPSLTWSRPIRPAADIQGSGGDYLLLKLISYGSLFGEVLVTFIHSEKATI